MQHPIDVLVAVGAAERFGQLDAFVEHHAPGHVQAVLELVGADPEHAVFDRREFDQWAVQPRRDQRVELGRLRDAAVQQRVEVHAVGLVEAGQVAREGVDVAGGIARGGAVASYLEMGAAGVQLGTRFVCAHESIAHPNFKAAFLRANARDAVASVQIDPRLPVIPVRALKNKGTEEFTKKQVEVAAMLDRGEIDMEAAQLEIEKYWAGALRRAVIDGDVEYGSVMAGQSVGMVHVERPVVDILAKLVDEANVALAR